MNKAIKYIALIEDASDAYVFYNNCLKYSFANFVSIFSPFECLYIVRFDHSHKKRKDSLETRAAFS